MTYCNFGTILASVCTALSPAYIFFAAKCVEMSRMEISLVVFIGNYMLNLPHQSYSLYTEKPISWNDMKYLILVGTISAGAVITYYVAMDYLYVSDLIALGNAHAVPTLLLSYIILKEKSGVLEVLVAFVSLGGVVLIARPAFLFGGTAASNTRSQDRMLGVIIAMLATLCFSGTLVLSRKIKSVSASSVLTCAALQGAVICYIYIKLTAGKFSMPCFYDFIFAMLAAVASYTCRILMFASLHFELPSIVSVILSGQVLTGFIYDTMLLNTVPYATSYIGGVLIMLGTAGSIMAKSWKST
ncbi:solute carrier family 35 member G1-like [Ciona intestinalis]